MTTNELVQRENPSCPIPGAIRRDSVSTVSIRGCYVFRAKTGETSNFVQSSLSFLIVKVEDCVKRVWYKQQLLQVFVPAVDARRMWKGLVIVPVLC